MEAVAVTRVLVNAESVNSGSDDVRPAIEVDVAHIKRIRMNDRQVDSSKGCSSDIIAIDIVFEDKHRLWIHAGNHEIRLTIPIHIGYNDVIRVLPWLQCNGTGECIFVQSTRCTRIGKYRNAQGVTTRQSHQIRFTIIPHIGQVDVP